MKHWTSPADPELCNKFSSSRQTSPSHSLVASPCIVDTFGPLLLTVTRRCKKHGSDASTAAHKSRLHLEGSQDRWDTYLLLHFLHLLPSSLLLLLWLPPCELLLLLRQQWPLRLPSTCAPPDLDKTTYARPRPSVVSGTACCSSTRSSIENMTCASVYRDIHPRKRRTMRNQNEVAVASFSCLSTCSVTCIPPIEHPRLRRHDLASSFSSSSSRSHHHRS